MEVHWYKRHLTSNVALGKESTLRPRGNASLLRFSHSTKNLLDINANFHQSSFTSAYRYNSQLYDHAKDL